MGQPDGGRFESFIARQFDALELILTMWGYEIASQSDRGEQSAYAVERALDPPIGKLVISGRYGLPEAQVARNVYVRAAEIWIPVPNATAPRHAEGFSLSGYSYHAQLGDGPTARLRFDYDQGHPGLESHVHDYGRRNNQRRFCTPLDLETAMPEFEQLLAELVHAGFVPTPR